LPGVEIEPLKLADAWRCTPSQYDDERGTFLEWYRADAIEQATGRRFTPVQGNHSVSRRGVLRGVHYADVPPGQAKYVYCARGAVLDVVVDIRVGSPTYGSHDSVVLDENDRTGVFISEGLGHGFLVLSDVADVTYLVSTPYTPTAEHALDPLDPALALDWRSPTADLVISAKDRAAPALADAHARALLPSYDECLARYAALAL
jgi:dTDP-4-dehydrorhamnose 3,5-epimerase